MSSFLLNGVPGRKFQCKCGVRQGDPLSPLIFVLAADLLQAAVNDAFARGLIDLPIPCNRDGAYPVVQYADDTIVRVENSALCIPNLKFLLLCFEAVSGLKINVTKSEALVLGCSEEEAKRVSNLLNSKLGTFPFNYVGIPISSSKLFI